MEPELYICGKNDEFVLNTRKLCIKNEEFCCIYYDEICIQRMARSRSAGRKASRCMPQKFGPDELHFVPKVMKFVSKMMNFGLKLMNFVF